MVFAQFCRPHLLGQRTQLRLLVCRLPCPLRTLPPLLRHGGVRRGPGRARVGVAPRHSRPRVLVLGCRRIRIPPRHPGNRLALSRAAVVFARAMVTLVGLGAVGRSTPAATAVVLARGWLRPPAEPLRMPVPLLLVLRVVLLRNGSRLAIGADHPPAHDPRAVFGPATISRAWRRRHVRPALQANRVSAADVNSRVAGGRLTKAQPSELAPPGGASSRVEERPMSCSSCRDPALSYEPEQMPVTGPGT